MGQPLTASEIATRNREVCKTRRAIAIEIASCIARENWGMGPLGMQKEVHKLIDISQSDHDKLVLRYCLKDKYEKRQ